MSKEVKKNEVVSKKGNKLIEFEKTLGDSVQNRITTLTNEGRLNLPKNYSVGNALNSAWLKILQTKDKNSRPALEVCTKESIANALLDMTILGLNPAKQQGYFIVYGNQLTWFTSYFGKCAALKRISGIDTEPIATLIYKGDEIELGHNELGEEVITKHITKWENKFEGEIVGAYATVKYKDVIRSAVMTMTEIREAWSKSQFNKEHKEFTGEFAKRTVINRLVKMILQTTNDDDLLAETMIENEYQHYTFEDAKCVEVQKEIEMNANTGEILEADFEDKEDTPLEKTTEEPNGWTIIEAPKEENTTVIKTEKVVIQQASNQPEATQTTLFDASKGF